MPGTLGALELMHVTKGAVVGIVALVALLVPSVAFAQDEEQRAPQETAVDESVSRASGNAREPTLDPGVELKVRRLRIAGWSFLLGSAGFLVGAIFGQNAGNSGGDGGKGLVTAIGLGMTSAALAVTGGALLIRARVYLNRHWNAAQSERSRSLSGGGMELLWSF